MDWVPSVAEFMIATQNGRVFVSAETLTVVISALGIVLTLGTTLLAGGAWLVRRIDDRIEGLDTKLSDRIEGLDQRLTDRIEGLDTKLSDRIDRLEQKLSDRIDGVENELGDRIGGLSGDVTDLKIAVARLEGPPRHLIPASR